MILEAEDFVFRCSALGVYMGGKTPDTLTETAKRLIEETYLISHGMIPDEQVSNKYVWKGNDVEDQAIEYYNVFAREDAVKNEEYFDNGIVCGTPDIILDDKVIDIKCPWSHIQYNKYKGYNGTMSCPSRNYWWQLQAYLWLTGKSRAELVYVLMDTPFELLEEDDEFISYESNMELEDRIKVFAFDFDESVIEEIKYKLGVAREYMVEVIKKYEFEEI